MGRGFECTRTVSTFLMGRLLRRVSNTGTLNCVQCLNMLQAAEEKNRHRWQAGFCSSMSELYGDDIISRWT